MIEKGKHQIDLSLPLSDHVFPYVFIQWFKSLFFGRQANQIKVGAALIICNGDVDPIRKNFSSVYEVTRGEDRIVRIGCKFEK